MVKTNANKGMLWKNLALIAKMPYTVIRNV